MAKPPIIETVFETTIVLDILTSGHAKANRYPCERRLRMGSRDHRAFRARRCISNDPHDLG
jgi:hypothetical protein